MKLKGPLAGLVVIGLLTAGMAFLPGVPAGHAGATPHGTTIVTDDVGDTGGGPNNPGTAGDVVRLAGDMTTSTLSFWLQVAGSAMTYDITYRVVFTVGATTHTVEVLRPASTGLLGTPTLNGNTLGVTAALLSGSNEVQFDLARSAVGNPTKSNALSAVVGSTNWTTSNNNARSDVTASAIYTPPNLAPVLAPIAQDAGGVIEADEGVVLSFMLAAEDPDDSVLTYSFTGFAALKSATIDPATGEFSVKPSFDKAGTHSGAFRVQDPSGAFSEVGVTLNVQDMNAPPKIFPVGDIVANEGDRISFGVRWREFDGDDVVFTARGLPVGAQFNPTFKWNTGRFIWKASCTDAGNYPITFRADDGIHPPTELTVLVTINAKNCAPTVRVPHQSIMAGETLKFRVRYADPEGDLATLSAGALPEGATFNPVNGAFAWTPGLDQAGVYPVTFFANDGSDIGEKTILITVSST